jgi:hypothetical protein
VRWNGEARLPIGARPWSPQEILNAALVGKARRDANSHKPHCGVVGQRERRRLAIRPRPLYGSVQHAHCAPALVVGNYFAGITGTLGFRLQRLRDSARRRVPAGRPSASRGHRMSGQPESFRSRGGAPHVGPVATARRPVAAVVDAPLSSEIEIRDSLSFGDGLRALAQAGLLPPERPGEYQC